MAANPPASDALDNYDAVRRSLNNLSSKQRTVLVLRFYCDLTEVNIAKEMECSVGAVKTHASRAIARLRQDPDLATALDTDTRRDDERA